METKKCAKCGRELPMTEFHKNRSQPDGLQAYCKSCIKERNKLRTLKRRAMAEKSGGGKLPPFSDPDFDNMSIGEVVRLMGRAKKWLESRNCLITLYGNFTETKVHKLKF